MPKPKTVPTHRETVAEADQTVADDEAIMNEALAAKKGAKASGGKATEALMKRPAAKAGPAKVPKAMKTAKVPQAKKLVVTLADKPRPPPPKESSTATMLWRGGKIYQASDRKLFRVLKHVGDRVTWGSVGRSRLARLHGLRPSTSFPRNDALVLGARGSRAKTRLWGTNLSAINSIAWS